jgi:hypothetical protein
LRVSQSRWGNACYVYRKRIELPSKVSSKNTYGIDDGGTLDYAAQRYIEQGILVIVAIELFATNVDAHVLPMCTVGLEVTLWTLPHLEFICFFAVGTYGGQGRIIKLAKSTIPGLTVYLSEASAEISEVKGSTCVIKIEIEVDESNFAEAQRHGWLPVR